MRISS